MIVIIDGDDSLTRRVEAALSHGERVEVSRSWADVASRACGDARACVYVAARLDKPFVDTLIAHQRDSYYLPTLVVTRDSLECVIDLGGARIHGVVTRADLVELPLLVSRAVAAASVAEQFACLVEVEAVLPQNVCRGLVNCTIRSDRIRARPRVAEAAGCELRHLDEALSKAFGIRPWVTWRYVVRTLRAYDLAQRGVRANELVARELATTTKALCRGYERIAAVRSFEELARMARRELLIRGLTALGLRTSDGSEGTESAQRVRARDPHPKGPSA